MVAEADIPLSGSQRSVDPAIGGAPSCPVVARRAKSEAFRRRPGGFKLRCSSYPYTATGRGTYNLIYVPQNNQVVEKYNTLLSPCSMLQAPCVSTGYMSAWAQYSILAKDEGHRAQLQTKLKDAGIPTAIYYPKPLHLQTAYTELGYKEGDFPISEDYSKRIFSLPMHPYLKEEEQQKIAEIIISSDD